VTLNPPVVPLPMSIGHASDAEEEAGVTVPLLRGAINHEKDGKDAASLLSESDRPRLRMKYAASAAAGALGSCVLCAAAILCCVAVVAIGVLVLICLDGRTLLYGAEKFATVDLNTLSIVDYVDEEHVILGFDLFVSNPAPFGATVHAGDVRVDVPEVGLLGIAHFEELIVQGEGNHIVINISLTVPQDPSGDTDRTIGKIATTFLTSVHFPVRVAGEIKVTLFHGLTVDIPVSYTIEAIGFGNCAIETALTKFVFETNFPGHPFVVGNTTSLFCNPTALRGSVGEVCWNVFEADVDPSKVSEDVAIAQCKTLASTHFTHPTTTQVLETYVRQNEAAARFSGFYLNGVDRMYRIQGCRTQNNPFLQRFMPHVGWAVPVAGSEAVTAELGPPHVLNINLEEQYADLRCHVISENPSIALGAVADLSMLGFHEGIYRVHALVQRAILGPKQFMQHVSARFHCPNMADFEYLILHASGPFNVTFMGDPSGNVFSYLLQNWQANVTIYPPAPPSLYGRT
jgi:hypothetical protein